VKPIIASVTVPHPREEVYDFLDVLGNHEAFTDHFLIDSKLSEPDAGIGAQARMRSAPTERQREKGEPR
jgi:hypothetical protein